MCPTNLETVINNLDSLSSRVRSDVVHSDILSDNLSGKLRDDEYEVALIDKGFKMKMPFVLSNGISQLIKELFDPGSSSGENSVKFFDWVVKNIRYGERKRGRQGYRNSVEVFRDGEGVCGEMTMLYLVMVRAIGMRGSFVNVDVDGNGKRVNHACAMIDVQGNYGDVTLVDPAYKAYDIAHRSVKPLTDFAVFKAFNRWD